jgi:hypothetical protein
MPKTKRVDEAALLAERMLQVLDSQRSFGGEAYPPTLRHLGELCDGAPPPELIVQAATKKVFTDKAVVTAKVDKKPSLDAPVYFKEDVPKPEELVAKMLEALEEQRRLGLTAYPPTLRRLAELSGVAGPDDFIVEAAGKKAFTDKAVVTEKRGQKPSLGAPVYFKEDVPKPDELLAGRMLAVLESQRPLGAPAYPPTLRRLAELCEVKASDSRVPKAVGHTILADRAVVVARKGKAPNLDAPVVLKEDLEGRLSAVLPALLRFALSPVTTPIKGKPTETAAFNPTELKKRLIPDLQGRVEDAVERAREHQDFPADADVAWVLVKGQPLFFLAENVRPRAPQRTTPAYGQTVSSSSAPGASPTTAPRPPARDFICAFREAFEQLDRRNGSTNFVKLAELRHALADFSREDFDAGLRQLRLDGLFALDSHEGLHGSLTHDEREAGVREAGSLLVYASRR